MLRNLIVFTTDFIDILLVYAIFSSVMPRIGSRKRLIISGLILVAAFISIGFFVSDPTLRLILSAAAAFIVSFICFRASLLSRLMAAVFFYCLYLISEFFAHGVVSMINQWIQLDSNAFFVGVAATYIYWLCFYLLYKKTPLRLYEPSEVRSRLLILAGSVSCAAVMLVFVTFIIDTLGLTELPFYIYLSCAVFFLAFNIIMMGFSKRMSDMSEAERQRLVYEAQANQLTRYTQSMDITYKQTRSVYHDLRHHLTMLYNMAGEKEKPEISAYMQNVLEMLPIEARFGGTGFPAVDVCLHAFLVRIEELGVNVDTSVSIQDIQISNTHISVVLGNALENALEASKKLQSPQTATVTVSLKQKGQYLHFYIANPVEWEVNISKKIPNTSKPDVEYHGYGLKNIEGVVNRYNGNMECRVENNQFIFQCMMQNTCPLESHPDS